MTSAPAAQDVDLVRSKLERSLKGSGTLDVIKTQVRGYLLQEIKRQGLGSATPRAEVSLEQRAADSLVLDHLRASRYSYTLSIFASESGLTEDALPPREACSVFELPEPCVAPTPPSPAGSTGGTQLDGQSALLSTLTGLTESRLSPSRHAVETTALTPPPAEPPLEEKLRSLDRALEARLKEDSPSGTSQAALEEQMLRVQRETDARAAATLNAEVQRLRQVETVTIRKQEQAAARVAVEEAAAVRRRSERAPSKRPQPLSTPSGACSRAPRSERYSALAHWRACASPPRRSRAKVRPAPTSTAIPAVALTGGPSTRSTLVGRSARPSHRQ